MNRGDLNKGDLNKGDMNKANMNKGVGDMNKGCVGGGLNILQDLTEGGVNGHPPLGVDLIVCTLRDGGEIRYIHTCHVIVTQRPFAFLHIFNLALI